MGNARRNTDFIVPWQSVDAVLYTQPVISEGNTAHTDSDLRFCLERVKIVKKWDALKDTVLQVHLTMLTTILEVIPSAEEQVRKISNKV